MKKLRPLAIFLIFILMFSSITQGAAQNAGNPVSKTPEEPGWGTLKNDVLSLSATHTGAFSGRVVKGANILIDGWSHAVTSANMVPKNARTARKITTWLKSKKNLEVALAKSAPGTKAFRHLTKALRRNASKIENAKVLSVSGARKVTALKTVGVSLKVGNFFLNGYGIYDAAKKINSGEYEHDHPSLRFVSDALRSASIAANSFSMATLGRIPQLEGAALITGLSNDLFNSSTFSGYMNSTDNFVIRTADRAAVAMNSLLTSPTATYIPEYLISKWYGYWGDTPSADALKKAELTHQKWLKYKESDEYKEKLARLNLMRKPGYGINVYKPNIYIYPMVTSDITLTFERPGLLEIAIPPYGENWKVMVNPDGTILAEDENTYGFLFYESLSWPFMFQTDGGWLIESHTREEQFKDILTEYGFNRREMEDFIEYWSNKLEKGVDYAMYPQTTPVVDGAMPVNINPFPDSLYRIWFVFEENAPLPSPGEIKPFIREGYTIIEWGGLIIPSF